MQIENLTEGMILKSYKHLCEVLRVKPKSGNSKISQLREFERFVRYRKDGNKFIIEEVFETPKSKTVQRGVNGKYTNDIQDLLIILLSQSKSGEVMLTSNVLLNKLNMVNHNYTPGRRNIPKLSELIGVDEDIIYDFYNTTNNNLVGALEIALKRLRSRRLIIWEKVIGVAKIQQYERNEFGEIILDIDDDTICRASVNTMVEYRQATPEEKQIIIDIENTVLNQLECRDAQSVFLTGAWPEYRRRVLSSVRKKLNIKYHFEAYLITYNHDNIMRELPQELTNIIEERLNDTVQNYIVSNAKTKHFNSLAKKKKIEEHEEILSLYSNEELNKLGFVGCKMRGYDYTRIKENFIESNLSINNTLVEPRAIDFRVKLTQRKKDKALECCSSDETSII